MHSNKIIAANWKMQFDKSHISSFFSNFIMPDYVGTLIISPSYPYLEYTKKFLRKYPEIKLGAQDCSSHPSGAYTGDVSAHMLADFGCEYVIVGHSERRIYLEENDEKINNKIKYAIASGLNPIICIGESSSSYNNGLAKTHIKQQLEKISQVIDKSYSPIIAYEPIWAIGTGIIPEIKHIEVMVNVILNSFDSAQVLYGGSVTEENANSISKIYSISGLLVGGASLHPNKFGEIIKQFSIVN